MFNEPDGVLGLAAQLGEPPLALATMSSRQKMCFL
jgi:hypothetical protein